LTEAGLELRQIMPGIDVERDILKACSAKINLPAQQPVEVASQSILNGQGFELRLKTKSQGNVRLAVH
ncbi:MAG: hypothetical protein L6Q97_26690, partial [Thermoanaerobaculia bacterium]|nr:hypothetical protein [Thermoanaerobaculia bacterium]